MKPKPWAGMQRQFARIEALSRRDRLALLAGGFALLGALEIQLVLPLHDRRVAAESQQLGPDQMQAQAQQSSVEATQAKLDALKQEWAKRQASPLHRARATAPQTLFAELRQNLALQGVQVVSLHALADEVPEPIKTDPNAAATQAVAAVADAASAADPAASDAAQPAVAAPTVYRHRAELRVSGALADVMRVLGQLERDDQAMRLERVLLSATEKADGIVLATFTLVAISEEQTWLEM